MAANPSRQPWPNHGRWRLRVGAKEESKFVKIITQRFFIGCLLLLAGASSPGAQAQINAPRYEECLLTGIYPASGRQGETVTVDLQGGNNANMSGAQEVIIDGPAGISVKNVKNLSPNLVQATLVIAPDAIPGRRFVRVLSQRSGLTNMIFFSVGRLPEVLEKEPNNETSSAQVVTLPVVVNGRVNPKTDVDCFRFELKKGQRLAAVVQAHALDSHGQGSNFGFADASLQILDERGQMVAEGGDTLGLDPQIEFVAPMDGLYVARVFLDGFEGFPQAVYRLVLGEVALATSVFPPGGQRGKTVEVELHGPNIKPGTRQNIKVPEDPFPLQYLIPDGSRAADLEVPFLRGDWPERLEVEPNGKATQATPIDIGMTVNSRIDQSGDEDWYVLKLTAQQSISLETIAQRYLRSPVDTLIQVFDSAGKKLAENDDGFTIDYVSLHDFRPMDSRFTFVAPSSGEYYVRVSDQSGNSGPRAVYRLTVANSQPGFELFMFPDGVPVWGPGSTAGLLVKVNRLDNMAGDIGLAVEGLPAGWASSPSVACGQGSKPSQTPVLYHFLTITAPVNAKPGEMVPFRVIGRAEVEGRTIERVAQPLTLYYTSDIGLFRATPLARAVVTIPQSPWLSTGVKTLSVPVGGTLSIPVEIHGAEKLDRIDLTVNLATNGVATAMAPPQTFPIKDGKALVTIPLGQSVQPGRHGITVSLRWRSDIRIGMPGPCTPLIALEVLPKTSESKNIP
jgi:hypothetical protein